MQDQAAKKDTFQENSEVRLMHLNGCVSTETYIIKPKSINPNGEITNKAQIQLIQKGTTREITVNPRRVLPLEASNQACVVEMGDKFKAICPTCGCAEEVVHDSISLECPKCSVSFPLYWLGVKPTMSSEAVTKPKKPTAEKAAKTSPKEKVEKVKKEPIRIDFDNLHKFGELWTMKNVKFDHVGIDVQAHCLLYHHGGTARKLCFNSYNGTYGKKSKELPLHEFKKDIEPEDGSPKSWYNVPDIEKARAKLVKDGYEKIEKPS